MQRRGMRSSVLLIMVTLAFAANAVGTAALSSAKMAPTAKKPPAQTTPPLPAWAPKHPSRELLRAATVLKPVPSDIPAGVSAPPEVLRAIVALKKKLDPRVWELFGSLSDTQLVKFKAEKRIEIHVPDLTRPQRARLEAVLNATKNFKLQNEDLDFRVLLYKKGAKENFANVLIGFDTQAGKMVRFCARVKGQEGGVDFVGFALL